MGLTQAKLGSIEVGVTAAAIDTEHYERFRRFLEQSCGIVLGDNKQYLVANRLGHLMGERRLCDLGALVVQLEQPGSAALRARVIDAMTTNETQWFRDIYPFASLKHRLLPELERRGLDGLRIWSAACSSGQEPYSISMAVEEYRGPSRKLDAQVVGTDISAAMIERARAGRYSAREIRRGLSPERQQRYFSAVDASFWQVRPELARHVSFQQHNLLDSFSPLGRFDLIFCRNVLIYFSLSSREDIIRRMARVLNPGGYLIVGASESLSCNLAELEMVRCQPGVVYRRKEGLR